MWLNASQQSIVGCDTDSRDMLPHRCPNCGDAEDEESQTSMTYPSLLHSTQDCPGYFHMRLLHTARVIAVTLVLLLGIVMVLVALLLFRSPLLSHQSESKGHKPPSPPEPISEKLQALSEGVSFSSNTLTPNRDEYLKWQNEDLKGGFTYSDGNLRVPTEGTYRVYLRLTFQCSDKCKELCDGDQMLLKISVKHLSPNYQKLMPLLVSEDTIGCTTDWTKSMYTSEAFKLDGHSILQVHALHPELIVNHNTHTMFRVERITS